MVEPAVGCRAARSRLHLPKDYVVAPLPEVDPEIQEVLEGSSSANVTLWR